MLAFLSGGTGTPKLLRGMRTLLADGEMAVVVNTAEDMWFSGGHLSPDIDTVIYLFSGLLNTETWWGIAGDTFATHDFLIRLGEDEFIALGDRDRAVNLMRAELLRSGSTLTEATRSLCTRLGIAARVLPMADTPVTTRVRTAAGSLHFQEYWVRQKGKVAISGVERVYETPPAATREVLEAIAGADAVILGPSNPVTSISPILECAGVRQALEDAFVVAVSPFIGDAPVSGPAADLMRAWGMEPSSAGTWQLYEPFANVFIQDIRDPVTVPGSVRFDTLMTGTGAAARLAGEILRIAGITP
ncbi:MAG: 2-phospho-L-lactate transferase [Methanomicrobiales archaeon]|nr:2-phospho-L-lactate transferase [Methanomicrobiales archaeon]